MFLLHPCFMTVQHDACCSADPFLHCSFFLMGFFHGTFPGAPLKFADLLLMSPVAFCSFVVPNYR